MREVSLEQIPYDCTHMWNLRSKINEKKEKKRDKQKNGLLNTETKLMVAGREVGGEMGGIDKGD